MSCRSCWFRSLDLHQNLLQEQVSLRERQTLVLSYIVSGSPEEKVSCWSLTQNVLCENRRLSKLTKENLSSPKLVHHRQSWRISPVVEVDTKLSRLSKLTSKPYSRQSWRFPWLSKLTEPTVVKGDESPNCQSWQNTLQSSVYILKKFPLFIYLPFRTVRLQFCSPGKALSHQLLSNNYSP